MALIQCPECAKENVSSTAIACPRCGFAIREFFNEKRQEEERLQQVQIESEIAKIRAKLDEFYIREGARWYRNDIETYKFFNRNGYMRDSEAIHCNNPGLGPYECIKYLEEAIKEMYNKFHETTQGITQYNEFIYGLFKILSFQKYSSFWSFGAKMDLLYTLHIEILERDTILEIAKYCAAGNYTVWSAGELNVLFQKLNEADRNLCISYFGQKYKPDLTNNIDIEGLYQKWIEYKDQNKEFDSKLVDSFKGQRSSIQMPEHSVANIYEEPKSVKQTNKSQHIPKCPTCSSPDIQKISSFEKAGSIALWGILSRKAHKQWHCNNCGSEW